LFLHGIKTLINGYCHTSAVSSLRWQCIVLSLVTSHRRRACGCCGVNNTSQDLSRKKLGLSGWHWSMEQSGSTLAWIKFYWNVKHTNNHRFIQIYI